MLTGSYALALSQHNMCVTCMTKGCSPLLVLVVRDRDESFFSLDVHSVALAILVRAIGVQTLGG